MRSSSERRKEPFEKDTHVQVSKTLIFVVVVFVVLLFCSSPPPSLHTPRCHLLHYLPPSSLPTNPPSSSFLKSHPSALFPFSYILQSSIPGVSINIGDQRSTVAYYLAPRPLWTRPPITPSAATYWKIY